MIKRISLIGIVALVVLSSCSNDEKIDTKNFKPSVDENTLGLIKSDVQSDDETLLKGMPEYSKIAAGKSKKIERAFENAPPMIPHMTTGFFPITTENNICLSCHMPEKIAKSKAVAIPISHFTDYRPAVKKVGDKYMVDAEEGEIVSKKLNKLASSRFYCTQCHVPQANVTVDIRNNFERVFRDDESVSKSNLDKNIGEGVK